ncbi:MAG: hypothetical protein Q9226_008711 [Calogaya cf. arnoldii]
MVSSKLALLLGIASLVAARVVKRNDPPFQHVPTKAQPDNSFHVAGGETMTQIGMPPDSTVKPDAIYGARSIDLPFGRLQHGAMKFFPKGELNTPTEMTDIWAPGKHDSAKQSACGIPDSAYQISKVAIHPYWLKFAPLERYCMQDVCISFWNEERAPEKQSDMMLKVTDICSTDPNDPTACLTPYDIKIDRHKAGIMERLRGEGMPPPEEQEALNGTEFKGGKTWWFFMKCWADGLAQPAYQSEKNWFTTPPIESNIKWAQKAQTEQVHNNKVSYKEKGWQVYPNGAFRMDRGPETAPLLDDWKEGIAVPEWCPVAGGKGFGIPTGKGCSSGASQTTSPSNSTINSGPSPYGNLTQAGGQASDKASDELSNETSTPDSTPDPTQDSSPSTESSGNSTPDKEPLPIPSLTPSTPVSGAQQNTSSEDYLSTAGDNSATGDVDEDDDETCAADEVEVDDKEAPDVQAPKTDQPTTDKPTTDRPITDKPTSDMPTTDKPTTDTKPEGTQTESSNAEDDEDTCAADEVWEN